MGNSQRISNPYKFSSVHPHRHGEQLTSYQVATHRCGSSPQAWGTAFAWQSQNTLHRFIPTGMGNSIWFCSFSICKTVHPHRHGEQFLTFSRKQILFGSSPQAWGTVGFTTLICVLWRFIPTGMGNRMLIKYKNKMITVHPHRHGEQLNKHWPRNCRNGSSPQAWGTALVPLGDGVGVRFIPTGMGNSCLS